MKNSFVSSAAILMAANAISKILGAILKIPLTYIMHEEGMAVYNTAFSVYAMLLAFITSGIPFAITKLTAQELAKNNTARVGTIVYNARLMLLAVGAIGTLVLVIGAEFFAYAMKEPGAVWAIRAIAPSLFLVAWGDVAKSAFQGRGNMLPTAISQCVESLVKLLGGYFFAVGLIIMGRDKAASGAALGVTAGEAAATLMLSLWYRRKYHDVRREHGAGKEVRGEIISLALPVLFMAITSAALSMIDTSLIRSGLLRSGLGEDEARRLYGAYSGYAMTILNLPSGFLATLGVSIIPVISSAAAVNNMPRIRSVTKKGLILAGGCGFLAAVVIAIFSNVILEILFHNTASGYMLKISAPSVFFVSVMQFSGAVLQAMGCTGRAFLASLTVGIIKVLSAIFLVSAPTLNIYGAAIGADIAFFAGMVMNSLFLAHRLSRDT